MRVGVVLVPILIAVLIHLPSPAMAQSAGVKGGVTLSQVSTNPKVAEDSLSTLADFAAGAFVVVSDGPISGQLEALVSRRGASIGGELFDLLPGGVFGVGDLVKLRLTYLDVSAFLRTQVGSGDSRLYFFGGPTVGFELESELVVPGFSPDLEGATEDIDLAATGGIGVDVNRLLVEVRYSHGLRNIVPTVDAFGVEIRHRTAMVLVGVRF